MMEKTAFIREEKVQQIGNVRMRYIQRLNPDAPVYCDGDEERKLYENFLKNNKYADIDTERKFSSWIEEYHLSPVRHNLLKWFPFNPEGSVLEIGAGCGALTGLLSQKLKKVTALEYSEQRAKITAMRHQQYPNLEVVAGSLQDFVSEQKFDYITVIGVLEYAGRFYGGDEPYKSFLTKVKTLLKQDGVLILAIENKIGVKYLCGAKEDHTEIIFESVYNYPNSAGVQTFSKKELSGILSDSGFKNLEWHYPLPDYKLPQQVISDDTLPRDMNSVWNIFPNGSRDKKIMSQKRLAKTLTNAGLFSEFANSFLVFAGLQNSRETSKCIYFCSANLKKKRKFRTNKTIVRNCDKIQFIVSPDNEEASEFISKIAERESLAKNFFGENAEVITGELVEGRLIYPYISFPSMTELIAEQIKSGDTEFGKSLIKKYVEFLSALPSERIIPKEFLSELELSEHDIQKPVCCISCGILDCVPRNIMVDSDRNKYLIIDNEFTYDFPVPIDFLIWSAVNTLVTELQDEIQPKICRSHPVMIFSGHGINRCYIPSSWLSILNEMKTPRKQLVRWYSAWQSKILSGRTKVNIRLKDKKKTICKVQVAEIAVKQNISEGLYDILRKAKRLL